MKFVKKKTEDWTSEKIFFLFLFAKIASEIAGANKQFCPDLICGNIHVLWTSIKMSSLSEKF